MHLGGGVEVHPGGRVEVNPGGGVEVHPGGGVEVLMVMGEDRPELLLYSNSAAMMGQY